MSGFALSLDRVATQISKEGIPQLSETNNTQIMFM